MQAYLIVALGGAVGACMRFFLTGRIQIVVENEVLGVPVSTLVVNVIGSALIGFLYVAIDESAILSVQARQFLITGLLASLTTFSSFSLDAIRLLHEGHISAAFGYIIASVFICIFVCWLSLIASRYVLT